MSPVPPVPTRTYSYLLVTYSLPTRYLLVAYSLPTRYLLVTYSLPKRYPSVTHSLPKRYPFVPHNHPIVTHSLPTTTQLQLVALLAIKDLAAPLALPPASAGAALLADEPGHAALWVGAACTHAPLYPLHPAPPG